VVKCLKVLNNIVVTVRIVLYRDLLTMIVSLIILKNSNMLVISKWLAINNLVTVKLSSSTSS
jgi:hypothetical protein